MMKKRLRHKKDRLKNIFLIILYLVPLVVGTAGYMLSGETVIGSVYAALVLYFGAPVSDAYNLLIEIAKCVAPLLTFATILNVVKYAGESIEDRVSLLGKGEKVSVYSDPDLRIAFEGEDIKVIYPGDKLRKYAKDHIIMFQTDELNLKFYKKHEEKLKGKKVYLGIRGVESCFLENLEGVTIFDVNSAIARTLWKQIALWNKGKKKVSIVVWGSDALSGEIIGTGLQMNLFSRDQKISYRFVTDNSSFIARHSEFKTMNGDKLSYLDYKDPDVWTAVSKADIIIVSGGVDVETMKTLAVKKSIESEIYYYSPEEDIISLFPFGNFIPFGRNNEILTDENIRRGALVEKAIALNEYYAGKYDSEKDWNRLPGILKSSCISSSDFSEVLTELEDRISEEEQAELEHIRWCRYMMLSYYTQGTPDNGKNRDDRKRIHKDLIAYEALDIEERGKDIEIIKAHKRIIREKP